MDNVEKKNSMPVDLSSPSNDITPTLLPSSSSSSSLQTGNLTVTRVPVQTTMSSTTTTTRAKSDVELLDDLVKDLLSEVNQSTLRTPSPARLSSSNGTGFRIRPGPTMNIPAPKSSNSQAAAMAASLDEQLIDSLLESVQNTLRKRAMHQQMPKNRRAHSSSSAYTDSIHRVRENDIEQTKVDRHLNFNGFDLIKKNLFFDLDGSITIPISNQIVPK